MGLTEATDSRELLPGLEDQPGHLMWRAAARVTVHLAEVLPEGVDIHAYAALLSLAGGTARTQQSIATTIDVSRTTMVKVAAELAEQGLVERVRNPDDRRSLQVWVTPKGWMIRHSALAAAHSLDDQLRAGFSAEDFDVFSRVLAGLPEQMSERSGDGSDDD